MEVIKNELVIHDYIKVSLIDYPDEICTVIFFSGCNFRCPFCHNAELVEPKHFKNKYNEILEYLEIRKNVISAVTITGGEPLYRKGLIKFIKKIKNMGYKVKLDTNGFYYDELYKILNSGFIDYVAMDIKNSPEKYSKTCGVKDVDLMSITKSIELIKKSNIPYEFRTTVVEEFHEKEDFEKIKKWIGNVERYSIQFFKDSGNILGSLPLSQPSKQKIFECKSVVETFAEEVLVKGE